MDENMLSPAIGTFKAKTHFSRLIAEVEGGHEYTITKHGKPVAKLIPFPEKWVTRREVFKKVMAAKKKFLDGGGSFSTDPKKLLAVIHEGHRA